jgi:hypothetical protein
VAALQLISSCYDSNGQERESVVFPKGIEANISDVDLIKEMVLVALFASELGVRTFLNAAWLRFSWEHPE